MNHMNTFDGKITTLRHFPSGKIAINWAKKTFPFPHPTWPFSDFTSSKVNTWNNIDMNMVCIGKNMYMQLYIYICIYIYIDVASQIAVCSRFVFHG